MILSNLNPIGLYTIFLMATQVEDRMITSLYSKKGDILINKMTFGIFIRRED